MAAADNYPQFNAAVAELTLKVQALISDVTDAHATLGPEVAEALAKLEAATDILADATQAATDAQTAAQSVLTFKTEFDAAMITIGTLTTNVGTLTTQVDAAMALMVTTQTALEAALDQIGDIADNLANVVKVNPAGITLPAHGTQTINTGRIFGNGGILLLGVYCTTSTPSQMYDMQIYVGTTLIYDARGILGEQKDTFSNFAMASGEVKIALTNNGSGPATLTPTAMFTELAIV
jgi:hypothetical protein